MGGGSSQSVLGNSSSRNFARSTSPNNIQRRASSNPKSRAALSRKQSRAGGSRGPQRDHGWCVGAAGPGDLVGLAAVNAGKHLQTIRAGRWTAFGKGPDEGGGATVMLLPLEGSQPSTLNPKPSTMNFKPLTLNPHMLNPEP